MPIGRPVAAIVLSPTEKEKLTLIASRSKSNQRDAQRARIILGASQGLTNSEIARRERVSLPTVGKWRSRYARERIEALADAPRSGAPRSIGDKKVEEILTKTLEGAPRARTHWSSRLMAKEAGISDHSVLRIWRAFGLKPHRVDSRIDAEFCDDGKSQLHLIIDNYATHKTPKVHRWLLRRPRFHLHFTPTGSSWLNMVERFFARITTEAIRRGSFSSVRQLKAAIDAYLAEHNKDPKPFTWTASADSIFRKLENSLS